MPTPDDVDPVQDSEATREQAPTLGELQQRWREATSAYWTCHRAAEQAEKEQTAARAAMEASEQSLGKAIAGQLTGDAYDHQGNALVTVNGLLLRVTRNTNGNYFYIRAAEVVRL